MATKVSAGKLFYQELRGCLDKGMTLQFVEVRKRKALRAADLEPVLYWKRTHGKNHVTLWGHGYLAELGAFKDD